MCVCEYEGGLIQSYQCFQLFPWMRINCLTRRKNGDTLTAVSSFNDKPNGFILLCNVQQLYPL